MSAHRILVVDDNAELRRLLCQLLEEQGHELLQAASGREALDLARKQPPALAIADILLPDMMGYHLAETLKREHSIPIVLMTGVFKGGRHAQDAKSRYGVAEYFEKPFQSSLLLEAVARLLPVEATVPKRPVSAVRPFEVELDFDIEEEQGQDALELTGAVRVTGENISAELKGAPLAVGASRPGQSGTVRRAPAGHPSHLPAPAVGESNRGELKDNLPALITAFWQAQETGELGVQRGKVKKSVYFEGGVPVFAQSNLVTDRFGQFLVRVGKITEPQLQLAMKNAEAQKLRTGDVLVQMGMLKETEQLYYVGQQVKSIIYSLFGWEDGTYQMGFRKAALKERIKLDVHPGNLILRGIKKLYKPERLYRLMLPEDRLVPSLQPAYALSDLQLEKWEAALVPSIDSIRDVRDLVALAGKPEAHTTAFLHALVALQILQKRG